MARPVPAVWGREDEAKANSLLLERRQAERRRRLAAPPSGVERRLGDRRRQSAAVTGAFLVATALASPAMARPPVPNPNPFVGAQLFVDPYSPARQQADAWRSSRPADAVQMDKIARVAQADWFGGWSGDIQAAVDSRVSAIAGTGALPVLVAYNIPNRDCSGGYSAGGAKDEAAYRDWIRRFSLGIGGRRAVVILEPDALADASKCGDAAAQQARLSLLFDAVYVLKADPAVSVYIDAGHSHWLPAGTAVALLNAAGVAKADGFALNVSNFWDTSGEVAYGRAISQKLGGKHFLVDTSRNGAGVAPSSWCNPPAMALGAQPTAATGDAVVDAFVWVKRPGESDGTCNGGPSAGAFWPDYALGLAQRSSS
jgi:endoglucanase